MTKKKIVLKLNFACDKQRTKAMMIAASEDGVTSVAIQGTERDQLVVNGEGINVPCLTYRLRKKICWTDIVTIEDVKPTPPKKEEKKVEDLCAWMCQCYPPCQYPCYPPCPPPMVCATYDTHPPCSIM